MTNASARVGLLGAQPHDLGDLLFDDRRFAARARAHTTLASPPSVTADPVETTAVVLKVVDGDTVDIRDDIRGRLRIRVLGIDTPATQKPGYTVGCWGPQATQFAADTLLGQRVAFVIDPTQDRTDRYGRTLAYLIRGDGWNYSVEAARAGAARADIYDNNPVQKYGVYAPAPEPVSTGSKVDRTGKQVRLRGRRQHRLQMFEDQFLGAAEAAPTRLLVKEPALLGQQAQTQQG
ncbi:hypothetical protein NGTWS0302_37070 [Mycolicibacterium cyprinidarum]|uniref:TNase-like domain-containing protein n=1 Tax=Mycolicibacterium cyprinidarum TaxID=2860311 RepID=A0ABQ4V966_9MYCO|nr:hypothetical protein NGTWS0302_37070 [Mycolicibacterium sp. NGTWS0302]GJF14947.1 hypothetical protein NGTWS1702_17590 [Mycolicibacterium sp. NGTWSNA01]